jgi:hypothetical protein
MAVSAIDNRTPWAVAILGVSGSRGEPALCVAIEATCTIADGRAVEAQPEICLDGAWNGEPDRTAPREAPCAPLPKHGTDCLLRGHGHGELLRFRCGPVMQEARLHGRRSWERGWFGIRPGPTRPFEPVPLIWEEAYGPQPGNPVGTGLVPPKTAFCSDLALPRITGLGQPAVRWGRAQPAPGFGATTPAWAHRRDLDPFAAAAQNVAAPELIAPALRGDEAVMVDGCRQPIDCRLPGLPPPQVRLSRRRGDLLPEARLDTVLVDADAMTLRLTWRAWTLVDGHELVQTVEIR